METHDTSLRIEMTGPGPDGMEAAAQALAAEQDSRPAQPVFQWQALLLRYLPDPIGPSHSVKRFALR